MLGYREGDCSEASGLLQTGLCCHRQARKIEQRDELEPSSAEELGRGWESAYISNDGM